DKRRFELKFEIQRTAGDLRNDAESLVAEFLRRFERAAMAAGAVHTGEQRRVGDRAMSLARDFGELAQEQLAADSRLHDSVSRLAHRRREHSYLIKIRHAAGDGLAAVADVGGRLRSCEA